MDDASRVGGCHSRPARTNWGGRSLPACGQGDHRTRSDVVLSPRSKEYETECHRLPSDTEVYGQKNYIYHLVNVYDMGTRANVISPAIATKSALIGQNTRWTPSVLQDEKGAVRRPGMEASIASIRYSQRSCRLPRTDPRFWKPAIALAPSQSKSPL